MNPTLLIPGGFALPSYGVLVALGIAAAVVVAWWLGRRENLTPDFVLDSVFWAVVAGFTGARLAYLAVSWRQTLQTPFQMLFSSGGGVYLAGFIAGFLAVVLLCRRRSIPFAAAADVFAPALALGHAFGRVGCHLAGCCWGCVVEGAAARFGVRYPRLSSPTGRIEGSWPWIDHLERGLITVRDAWSRPVLPVQLLEAFFDVLLFGALLLVWKKRRFRGQVALSYAAAYAAARFTLEYLRGDAERGLYGPFSFSQWICLAVAAALPLAFRRLRKEQPQLANYPD